uniref:CHK kinase-like domain-containing protein n=1 Tax=Homalodisca liturata TaxID=320908 RepID=A0A1B6I277_9HEMI
MDKHIPGWLNESFLATALQGEEKEENKISLVDYAVEPATSLGSNYSSYLFRVRVVHTLKDSNQNSTTCLIVKVPITEGFFKEMSQLVDYFGREPIMYGNRLPIMFNKINHEFGPKSFHCPIKNVLVLEDLKAAGYVVGDKIKQLDYPHCEMVMKTLAKFHATSVACYQDDEKFLEGICSENFFIDGALPFKLFTEGFMKHYSDALDDLGVDDRFKEIFHSRVGRLWESGVAACKPKKRGLNVLNHGDVWSNNMMFKYDSCGNVVDVKFFDYQRTRFGSPVLDLIYFLWTSGNSEVMESRQKELYCVYRETLNSTLELLDCEERLSEEELQQDLESNTDWALIVMCFIVTFTVAEPESALDMEAMSSKNVENDNNRNQIQRVLNGNLMKTLAPRLARNYQQWVNSMGQ